MAASLAAEEVGSVVEAIVGEVEDFQEENFLVKLGISKYVVFRTVSI